MSYLKRLMFLEMKCDVFWLALINPLASAVECEDVNDCGAERSLQCPEMTPYLASGADYSMDEFVDELDFVDTNGGGWPQGFFIDPSEVDWSKTRLRVVVMPHSHNDPGWQKTLDRYNKNNN